MIGAPKSNSAPRKSDPDNLARPEYWAVAYFDPSTDKQVSIRLTDQRCTTHREALRGTFGHVSRLDNFVFTALGTTMVAARRAIRQKGL